jgi:hypothetical protein
MYVQYGCGWDGTPEGWLNFDASPTLRLERVPLIGLLYTKNQRRFPPYVKYGDIVKGLPIDNSSCRGIYCSHVLEHLALADFERALANTATSLAPGGTFRMVLPDLEYLARSYLASGEELAAVKFMEASGMGKKHRPRNLKSLVIDAFGNSQHLWLWDEKSLAVKLRSHGFTAVRRAQFGDAEDPRFNEVENKDRFDGCLAMQCRKPG